MVKIQIKFGHNSSSYKGYETWHGKLAEVDVSQDKTWEEVLLNDFHVSARFDCEQFVVQGFKTSTAKKHNLEESMVELLQECEPGKKDGVYRIYVVFKSNFKIKNQGTDLAFVSGSNRKTLRPFAKQQKQQKLHLNNGGFRLHNVRTIAHRDPLAPSGMEDVDVDNYIGPVSQEEEFLIENDVSNYLETVDDDVESVLSQHSQFEEKALVPYKRIMSQEDVVSDMREAIKERVDNFGRRNLLQIREELLGVMRKDGQYSKWGLVAPSATFFLEQVFQLRGFKNG